MKTSKLSSSGKVVKNSILYSLGEILGKAASVILMPVYTAAVPKSEYGVYSTITSFILTFSIVLTLSLRAAILRFYNTFSGDEGERRRFLGSVVLFVVAFSGAAGGLLLLVNSRFYFMSGALSNIDFYPFALFAFLILIFDAVYTIYKAVLQARQAGVEYSVNNMAFLFVHAGLNLFFLLVVKNGVIGLLWAHLISVVLFAAYGVVSLFLKKIIVFAFDAGFIRKSVLYSLPILPHNLSNTISSYIAKLILNGRASFASSGLSDTAARIITIVATVQGSINVALRPWFNERMDSGDKQGIKRLCVSLMSASTFFCLALAVFGQEASIILTDKSYHLAWIITPILALAQAIHFIYYVYVLALMYNLKASRFAVVCSVSGGLANILSSYFLVGVFYGMSDIPDVRDALGCVGTALGALLGKIVLTAVTVFIANRFEKTDFGLSRMLLDLGAATLVGAAAVVPGYLWFIDRFNILYFAYKVLLFAAYTAWLFVRYRTVLRENKDVILQKLHLKRR